MAEYMLECYHAQTEMSEDAGMDSVDGFFSQNQGSYNPRENELIDWGTETDSNVGTNGDDPHDVIAHLVSDTWPESKWRCGILKVMRTCSNEADIRMALTFLYNNARDGIEALPKGFDAAVHIAENSAPSCLQCSDWMEIMDGLGFVLTSPGTVFNIDHVDVTIGKKTDELVLTGFCNVLYALLDMSWTNLQTMVTLDDATGNQLYEIMDGLCKGYGLDEPSRQVVEETESRLPWLMKSLGFRRRTSDDSLQWQEPHGQTEYSCLCLALHGLYRNGENIKTLI